MKVMTTSLRVSKLFTNVTEEGQHSSVKVTIVGAGQVGMAAAFAMLTQGVVSELALVDNSIDKLKGEMLDLQHGQAFLRRVKVVASTDYAVTAGSKICVVTAGARQNEGETRLQLVQKNVAIFKNIIPNLVKHSPNCILVIVSNPVDVLTYVAWKISGLPRNQVIGSGTMLDSSRFRFLLSQKIGIAPSSCHGYIIGEHGDSSVAVWSSVNIAGTRMKDIHPEAGEANDPEKWDDVHKEVINSAYEIIKLKGYTSWAIGVMISTLCSSILKNQKIIYSLSTLAKGYHGIEEDVFLSLPCVVGEKGITAVFNQKLLPNEIEKVKSSAKLLSKIVKEISV